MPTRSYASIQPPFSHSSSTSTASSTSTSISTSTTGTPRPLDPRFLELRNRVYAYNDLLKSQSQLEATRTQQQQRGFTGSLKLEYSMKSSSGV
ncbi:hypothetical protein HMI54_005576 [Coelomomyces lativittatus]|nr:hypothetical protein HMI54_005576 [Coelomomyces lativittatus]KAJ1507553.1 hypothetical protein HMI56_000037 [Coelomomyces lativittatus]